MRTKSTSTGAQWPGARAEVGPNRPATTRATRSEGPVVWARGPRLRARPRQVAVMAPRPVGRRRGSTARRPRRRPGSACGAGPGAGWAAGRCPRRRTPPRAASTRQISRALGARYPPPRVRVRTLPITRSSRPCRRSRGRAVPRLRTPAGRRRRPSYR